MSQSRSGQCWKLGLASAFTIGAVLALYGDYALAYIRSEGTPVAESLVQSSDTCQEQQAKKFLQAIPNQAIIPVILADWCAPCVPWGCCG